MDRLSGESQFDSMPRRSLEMLRQHHDQIERLVGWVQFFIFSTLGALYLASTNADGGASQISTSLLFVFGFALIFNLAKIALTYRFSLRPWTICTFIVVDMSLLFSLIFSLHLQFEQPPAFYLKAPTLLYVFIFIALRTLRLEYSYVLVSGATAALGWLFLAGYAAFGDMQLLLPVTRDFVVYMTSPTILWGAEIYKILSISMVTGVLALAVRRGCQILDKQHSDTLSLEQHRRELALAAFRDETSGLLNLAGVAREIEQSAQSNFGIVVIELEGLRKKRAVLGQWFIDYLVQETARRLQEELTPNCFLARISEAEILVAKAGADQLDEMMTRIPPMTEVLEAPFQNAHRSTLLYCKVGVALWQRGNSLPDAVQNAQIAALRADSRGGQRIVAFDDDMRLAEVTFAELEHDLRAAIENKTGIFMHYQPIVDIRTKRILGLEALVRWQHETKGVIMPGDFISLAEATGLIIPLGRRVLELASQDLITLDPTADRAHYREPTPGLFMSINFSARQLADIKMVDRVRQSLATTGVDPSRVKVEITESEAMSEVDNVRQKLMQLKEMGLRLSIDDFGTGHSSLSQLRHFPFDNLKIDKSFVIDVATSEPSKHVIQAMVDLAHSFGVDTVAEGIKVGILPFTLQCSIIDLPPV